MVKKVAMVSILILVTGSNTPEMFPEKFKHGFTLIELLVVIVIVGLFASMVMMTVTPNNSQMLERESKRLMQVMQLAQDEAVMQGVELGLTIQTDRYFFSRLQENQWLPLTADRQFSENVFNSSIMIELEVEDERVVQQVSETIIPTIMILSSGELTGFKLSLFNVEQPDKQYQIVGQENGQLSWQEANE